MRAIRDFLEPEEEIDAADLYSLLGNRRRKYTVAYMNGVGAPVELGETAEHVCALRKDKSLEDVTKRERKRAYSALRQSHIPKLEEHEIVDFSEEENLIDYGSKFDMAARYASVERVTSGKLQRYGLGKLSSLIL